MYIKPQNSSILETSLVEDVYDSFVSVAQTNVTIALINKTGVPCKPQIDFFVGNATSINVSAGYYYIYVSPHIVNSLDNCSSSFMIGNIQQKKVLSEVLLENIKNKYYGDYASLKNELKIPNNVDFAVIAENYELTRTIPEEIGVTAKIYRMQMLYSNGSFENKDMVMKNKRGWLRIFEAIIAIMIILGALLLFYKNANSGNDFSSYVSDLESRILKDISTREDLRGFVLQGNETAISSFVFTSLPTNLNFTVKICGLNATVCSPNLAVDKDLIVQERIISSNLQIYSPKIIRLFVWEK
jgi:hypothetical protein